MVLLARELHVGKRELRPGRCPYHVVEEPPRGRYPATNSHRQAPVDRRPRISGAGLPERDRRAEERHEEPVVSRRRVTEELRLRKQGDMGAY